jgi:hypothetical protein
MDRPINRRIWISTAIATPLSIASALSFLFYIGQGIVAGDLLGLPGRESDVAIAQQWAARWLFGSFCLLAGAICTMTFALPFYADSSPIPRTIARFAIASILCLGATVLIGYAAFLIIRITVWSIFWARF